MSEGPIHSTGRGGAGNIGHDNTVYGDAEIVREATPGVSERQGEYSTGRGGAGNIGKSPALQAQDADPQHAQDYIPEASLRQAQENYHTGRGGGGNVHKEKYGGHTHAPDHKGLGDKVKHALGLDKEKKEGEERKE